MILTLSMLALIATVLGNTFITVNFGQVACARFRHQAAAQEAARAGLAEAVVALSADGGWTAGFRDRRLSRSHASYTVTFQEGDAVPASTNNLRGMMATVRNGREVPAGCVHLVSQGRSANQTARSEVIARIAFVPPLTQAVRATHRISLRSTEVDSFDSQVVSPPGSDGDLLTDSSVPGSIDLRDATIVRGSATVGPGAGPEALWQQPGTSLTGMMRVASHRAPVFSVAPPRGPKLEGVHLDGHERALPPGNYGALTLAPHSRLVLTSGTYVFDSLVADQASIEAAVSDLPARIYVRGPVRLQGSRLVNSSRIPDRLWLIGTGTGAFSVGLEETAYAVLYAPRAPVTLNGGELFGAVQGNSVQVRLAGLHYDVRLAETPGPIGGITVLARWGD